MKIIVSHDVDHLYFTDHIFKDFYIPKLIIRNLLRLCRRLISVSEFVAQITFCFKNRITRIPEIIEFDKNHNVPSTFFFGMRNALGMSYSLQSAGKWIEIVKKNKFEVGVHGIDFENLENMNKEYIEFHKISNLKEFGIRMHYVRYNNNTFLSLSKIGYKFDTSEFCKKQILLKNPYKINQMWEFPLQIMDVYIVNGDLALAKKRTIEAIKKAIKSGIKYFTFLFHDNQFDERMYPTEKAYYEWFINYCTICGLEFISYSNAIRELEQ